MNSRLIMEMNLFGKMLTVPQGPCEDSPDVSVPSTSFDIVEPLAPRKVPTAEPLSRTLENNLIDSTQNAWAGGFNKSRVLMMKTMTAKVVKVTRSILAWWWCSRRGSLGVALPRVQC